MYNYKLQLQCLKILWLYEVTKYMSAYFNEYKLTCASNLNSFIKQIKQSAHISVFEYFWNSSPTVSSTLTVIIYFYIYIHI